VALVAAILLAAGIEAVQFSRMIGMMTDVEGVPEWWIQALLPAARRCCCWWRSPRPRRWRWARAAAPAARGREEALDADKVARAE
jgi:hypothetical protein